MIVSRNSRRLRRKTFEGHQPVQVALCLFGAGSLTLLLIIFLASPAALAEDPILELFPIAPFSLDLVVHSVLQPQTSHLVSVQGGLTALRYGDLEVRGLYRYFNFRSESVAFHDHVLLVNARWNNFLDLLDFPKDRPISRLLRHLLFGPLEDRVVPYVGALGGPILPIGHANTGYWYGGQLGVRFPVGVGLSLDIGVEYDRFGGSFRNDSPEGSQWLLTTGIVF